MCPTSRREKRAAAPRAGPPTRASSTPSPRAPLDGVAVPRGSAGLDGARAAAYRSRGRTLPPIRLRGCCGIRYRVVEAGDDGVGFRRRSLRRASMAPGSALGAGRRAPSAQTRRTCRRDASTSAEAPRAPRGRGGHEHVASGTPGGRRRPAAWTDAEHLARAGGSLTRRYRRDPDGLCRGRRALRDASAAARRRTQAKRSQTPIVKLGGSPSRFFDRHVRWCGSRASRRRSPSAWHDLSSSPRGSAPTHAPRSQPRGAAVDALEANEPRADGRGCGAHVCRSSPPARARWCFPIDQHLVRASSARTLAGRPADRGASRDEADGRCRRSRVSPRPGSPSATPEPAAGCARRLQRRSQRAR